MSNSIITIILLALLGFILGVLMSGAAKHKNKKSSAVPEEQSKQAPDEMAWRQLTQLKQQLDSGLITKEEYQEKHRVFLRE